MDYTAARHVRHMFGRLTSSAHTQLGKRHLRTAVDALRRDDSMLAYMEFSRVQFHLDRAKEIDARARMERH